MEVLLKKFLSEIGSKDLREFTSCLFCEDSFLDEPTLTPSSFLSLHGYNSSEILIYLLELTPKGLLFDLEFVYFSSASNCFLKIPPDLLIDSLEAITEISQQGFPAEEIRKKIDLDSKTHLYLEEIDEVVTSIDQKILYQFNPTPRCLDIIDEIKDLS